MLAVHAILLGQLLTFGWIRGPKALQEVSTDWSRYCYTHLKNHLRGQVLAVYLDGTGEGQLTGDCSASSCFVCSNVNGYDSILVEELLTL